MKHTRIILKKEISSQEFEYTIDGYKFKLFKLNYAINMNHPWRLECNDIPSNTQFGSFHAAKNNMIAGLCAKDEYRNCIFTVKTSLYPTEIHCECGKDKHNFFDHMFYCPKYKNKQS